MRRAATISDLFNAVAEPQRRDILGFVVICERPVGGIVIGLEFDQPSVSKHMGIYRKSDWSLLVAKDDSCFTGPNAEGLLPQHEWAKSIEQYWAHQLVRIKERAGASSGRRPEMNSNKKEKKSD